MTICSITCMWGYYSGSTGKSSTHLPTHCRCASLHIAIYTHCKCVPFACMSSVQTCCLVTCITGHYYKGADNIAAQYAAKLHGEKVKRFLHKQNGKLGIQYFRPRQAPSETSEQLTGYASGSVTPVGLQNALPILMSDAIANLQPAFFWMGGGEEFLKLGLNVHDFITAYKPFIVDCTY